MAIHKSMSANEVRKQNQSANDTVGISSQARMKQLLHCKVCVGVCVWVRALARVCGCATLSTDIGVNKRICTSFIAANRLNYNDCTPISCVCLSE